ncbi:MAG: SDR family NAD(P)-dependent oxidoreductase [Planctomycetaceae bacterium]
MPEDSPPTGTGSPAGRVALITGSGVGIGRETALCLAKAGIFVGVHFHHSQSEAEQTLTDIQTDGGRGMLLQADLTEPTACAGVVDRLVDETGRLDILVNNAGGPIKRTLIEDCSLDLWNQIVSTNLTSAFLVTQRAIPHLQKSGDGAIVNNLSLSVQTGGANGAGVYAIAKGGLQVLTRTLARELAPGIRTNAIMPGVIETRHHEIFTPEQRMQEYRQETPLGRNGQPGEVAATICFLVSNEARFINGALIDINGGRFLR